MYEVSGDRIRLFKNLRNMLDRTRQGRTAMRTELRRAPRVVFLLPPKPLFIFLDRTKFILIT